MALGAALAEALAAVLRLTLALGGAGAADGAGDSAPLGLAGVVLAAALWAPRVGSPEEQPSRHSGSAKAAKNRRKTGQTAVRWRDIGGSIGRRTVRHKLGCSPPPMIAAGAMGTMSAENAAQAKPNEAPPAERLSGARADFVAGLGRRRSELKSLYEALAADPKAKRPRDEMRRKIHALGAGAKLLRFQALSDELRTVEEALGAAAQRGELEPNDLELTRTLIAQMTSLAWGQTNVTAPVRVLEPEGPISEAASEEPHQAPISVLCVGNATLAASLGEPNKSESQAFEIESTADPLVAMDVARALAPDLVIVDADLPNAKRLVSNLVSDPLTESVPVLVIMRVSRTDDAGPYLALGVAKVLPKPVSPGELRRACASVITSYVRRETTREPLGDLTIDQLGARLAEELHRGLCDAADPAARNRAITLGEGTEVLAALWGAVARIRDLVTIRTQGQTRFAMGGPEGAVPFAPWLEETNDRDTRRTPTRSSRSDEERSLDGMKVLVVDDDAAVCWFLAGVLKTAGAVVYEARDGQRALEIAKHVGPDLVISDILMPKLDGFGLSRALRHDIVLRDVPIVLLSWKEDLLQRVRELGADVDGYLRKEASAGTIVQRVRELVRPRARIRQRIRSGTDVRGRLDGLTTFSLMNVVCEHREEATLTVRDASYLYEVDVRASRPVRATRTALSGAFDRGPSVLAALLGVGDGRFSVSTPKAERDVGLAKPELDGKLLEQLAPIIATARSAQTLLTGENLMRVGRVEVDEDALLSYFQATPEPARSLMVALSQGACPRDLLTTGRSSARMLEDILLDIASHAAVVQVLDGTGEDQLPRLIKEELALLRGERSANPVARLPVITAPIALPQDASAMMPALSVDLRSAGDLLRAATKPAEPEPSVIPPVVTSEPRMLTSFLDEAGNQSLLGDLPAQPLPEPAPPANDAKPLSPSPAPVQTSDSEAPRAYESPVPPSGTRLTPNPIDITLSPLPEALFRVEESRKPPVVKAEAKRAAAAKPSRERELELTPTPSQLPLPPGVKPMLTLGSLHPPEVAESAPARVETPKPKNVKKSPPPSEVKERNRDAGELSPRVPLPSAYLPPMAPYKRDYKSVYWVAFALLGIGFAIWARWARESSRPSEAELFAQTDQAREQNVDSQPSANVSKTDSAPEEGSDQATRTEPSLGRTADPQPEELPLRSNDKVKKGHGLLEVVAGKTDTILVDGKPIGSGPIAAVQLRAKADPYEIRVKTRGEERSRFVQVKEDKLVRIRLAPPWQR